MDQAFVADPDFAFVKRPSVGERLRRLPSGAHFALWLRSLAVLPVVLSPPLLLSCCDPPTRGAVERDDSRIA